MTKVLIETSARHCHLTDGAIELLFGRGYRLEKMKDLSIEGSFSAVEKVDLRVGSKILKNIRIIGPNREKIQVEISLTDARKLDLEVSIRNSGDLENTFSGYLVGPVGEYGFQQGLIVAKRHLHCSMMLAEDLGLSDLSEVKIEVDGERSLIFEKVGVKIHNGKKSVVHLDTDEANAADIAGCGWGKILLT